MSGEKDLDVLLKTMKPRLNVGEYVFCTIENTPQIDLSDVLAHFKEEEGVTVILNRDIADTRNLSYHLIVSWITLTVHSPLEAVGLTAAFSRALAAEEVSCNVVAGYFHDHIFVAKKDAEKAMTILNRFSE